MVLGAGTALLAFARRLDGMAEFFFFAEQQWALDANDSWEHCSDDGIGGHPALGRKCRSCGLCI